MLTNRGRSPSSDVVHGANRCYITLLNRKAMKPMRLAILAVVLTCLSGCTTVVKTVMFHHPQIKSRFEPPPLDTNVTGEAWIEYAGEGTNQITVLHVKA